MTQRGLSRSLTRAATASVVVAFSLTCAALAAPSGTDLSPEAQLGKALFAERNFTNPGADYGSSCGECHVDGAAAADRPDRSYADSVPLSLLAGKRTTMRNTPTLLEAANWRGPDGNWQGGWAGQWPELVDLLTDKLTGTWGGWAASDRQRAAAAIQLTLAAEAPATGAPYAEQFKAVYGVDVASLPPTEGVGLAARALAAYLATLTSSNTSRWDAFAEQNRLRTGPNEGQSAQDYSFFLESRIGNQEGRQLIKRPEGFTAAAYEGFKIFFRTLPDQLDEAAGVGNCVQCHTPPSFRDGRFHNAGVAELEYDAIWGEGAADRLELAEGTAAARADARQRGAIDLGRWHVHPEEPGSRGAFKTPSLRTLAGTDPFLHNGSAATLEEVIRSKMRAAEGFRAGKLQHVDPLIGGILLRDEHVAPLAAFLRQLEDVGAERFRYYLIHFDD